MSSLTINGEALRLQLPGETPLLWALRDAVNLTGTKHGCDSGECGACTVIIDGQAVKSCQVSIASVEGALVTTIEGMVQSRGGGLRQAWLNEQVGQCGYCEPGLNLALTALLQISPKPSEAELATVDNICRCGIGPRVRKAILRTVEAGGAPGSPPPSTTGSSASNSSRFSNGSSGGGQESEQ